MLSFLLVLLVVLILIYLKYKNFPQKEGLETQEELPDSFSTFTLNNVPLQMIYWSNRLNGNATTGDIDPEKIADDLKAASKTMNIALYGDEDGINLKYIGLLSSIPFTINNLPLKMSVWAKRLKGDSSDGTTSPQVIANEIQYCSFLLSQALNGGSVLIYNNSNKTSINDLKDITNENEITTYEPRLDDLEDITDDLEDITDNLEYEPRLDDLKDNNDEYEDLEDITDEYEDITDEYEDLEDLEDLEDITDEYEELDGFRGITNFFPVTQSNKQTKKAYNNSTIPFKTSALGYTSIK